MTAVMDLDDAFARELPALGQRWAPVPGSDPALVVLNDDLARALGLDPTALRSSDGIAVLAGSAVPDGAAPVAQAYAGHQFGGYSPRLGDGRALLLGEVVDPDGVPHDIHLKGSGRTPFARGGDGRAALGPMLREYLIAEAMHALGVPTTRALAVATTGDAIVREVGGRGVEVPGAVLTRVAASHLRVGTFQFAAATGDAELLRSLADFAIARHVPEAAEADHPPLALYDHVIEVQAQLVARWMHLGFIHGVMNTDNMTISGQSIDYGPCAFMDAYDPATVYSSIDHGGRYAYGNQPAIATWNLARLGESMLGLFHDDADAAVELATEHLQRFPELFQRAWIEGMRDKVGFGRADDAGDALIGEMMDLLAEHRVDYTGWFRALAVAARGDRQPARELIGDDHVFDGWADRWAPHLADGAPERMDRVNPIYVPRNHLVEEALAVATAGDLTTFDTLLGVVTDPFVERPRQTRFAEPAPTGFAEGYRTFCGT